MLLLVIWCTVCLAVIYEGRFGGGVTDPQDQDHTDQPQCEELGKRYGYLKATLHMARKDLVKLY